MRTLLVAVIFVLALSIRAFGGSLDTFDYAIIGDAGEWNDNSRAVRDSIVRKKVTNLILPGDNLYDEEGSYDLTWSPWLELGLKFNIVALGNHTAGYQEEIDYFKMPGEMFEKVVPGLARFLVLNSDNVKTVGKQEAWLERQLQAAQERFVFLVYHHPTYTITNDHQWREKEQFQLAVRRLLQRYRKKITAVIIGHDHIASLIYFGDLPAIVSGSVQVPRSAPELGDWQEGVFVQTAWLGKKDAYWAKLSLSKNRSKADVSFVRASDDAVLMKTSILTGSMTEVESR